MGLIEVRMLLTSMLHLMILIRRAKANPDLYSDSEIKYAKLIKRTLKLTSDEPISENQSK